MVISCQKMLINATPLLSKFSGVRIMGTDLRIYPYAVLKDAIRVSSFLDQKCFEVINQFADFSNGD